MSEHWIYGELNLICGEKTIIFTSISFISFVCLVFRRRDVKT